MEKPFSSKPHALEFSPNEWEAWLQAEGYPRFVAKQILGWIYQKNVLNPLDFSNISMPLRDLLAEKIAFSLPEVASHLISLDGSQKFLLKSEDGLLFEMVLMPYSERVTLCVSSQVGCKMGCTFCQTGKMGLTRSLLSAEILAQILLAHQYLEGRRVSNVVFMGMGEPLDNYEAVLKACKMMLLREALGLSASKVTISTSGLIPEINRLGQDLPVRLAISLHSANESKRSAMMPVNRKYPLAELKKALLNYPAPKKYGITFEYVMIQGKNDTPNDAKELVRFLHGLKAKVNLIPVNHFPGIAMSASDAASLRTFQSYLSDRGIPAPIRYSRGQDISGGCGQLAAKKKEEITLDPRELHKERRKQSRLKIFAY